MKFNLEMIFLLFAGKDRKYDIPGRCFVKLFILISCMYNMVLKVELKINYWTATNGEH